MSALNWKDIVSFRWRLNIYLINIVYPPYLVSTFIDLVAESRIVYDYEIARSFGFVAPLSLIFEDMRV